MSLGRTLAYLYPDADPGSDYTVRLGEDGEPFIDEWNLPGAQPTASELEQAALEAARAAKTDELATAAAEDLAPLFTEGSVAGRDELMFLLAGHVKQICEALGIAVDPRLGQVQTVGNKALAKKGEVEAATSLEGVEAIEWEEPA